MDRMAFIFKAYEIADEIKSSVAFQTLNQLAKEIESTLLDKVTSFQQASERFSSIQSEGGSYHPDFKEAALHLSQVKKDLFDTEIVKQYLVLEKEIQKQLDDFSRALANKISSHVGTVNELGLLKENSCHVG